MFHNNNFYWNERALQKKALISAQAMRADYHNNLYNHISFIISHEEQQEQYTTNFKRIIVRTQKKLTVQYQLYYTNFKLPVFKMHTSLKTVKLDRKELR